MSALAASPAPRRGSGRITSWHLLLNNRLATGGLVLLGLILLDRKSVV